MALEHFPLDTNPDWGLSDDPSADVYEQKLGDGYIVRRPRGLNYLSTKWNPSWGFLDPEEAEDIYIWLKNRLSLTPFLWTHPTTKEVHQVTCSKVSRVISTVGISTVNATFESDFNPIQ